MAKAQQIVSLARFLREKSKIRVRQPLRRILLPVDSPQERRDIQAVADIIKEEINIKEIEFVTDETSAIVSKRAKANFKSIGKKFGKSTQKVANAIKDLPTKEVSKLIGDSQYKLQIDGEEFLITLEDVEIFSEDIEGWLVASENGITVALDTALDEDLLREGIAREFINRIQNLRKSSGFEVTDRIDIFVSADENIQNALSAKSDYIKNETLAENIEFVSNQSDFEKIDIEEAIVFVKILKK